MPSAQKYRLDIRLGKEMTYSVEDGVGKVKSAGSIASGSSLTDRGASEWEVCGREDISTKPASGR